MKIIPRESRKHLEWTPDQQAPQRPSPAPAQTPSQQKAKSINASFTIDDILKGKEFYDASLPTALHQAIDYAGLDGIANLPEFLAAKIKAPKKHKFWNEWYSVHTEENIGIDYEGDWYAKGEPVLVVVHGGGILTPERIKKAYDEGLISGSAKYFDKNGNSTGEFEELLKGTLPDAQIPMYKIEDIKTGISHLPHRYGIVMPYSMAQETKSTYYKKKGFIENPLAIARAGGSEILSQYHDLAKDSDGDVGVWHPFEGRDATQPQGRVLFVNNNNSGLFGLNDLNSNGRFVGVAPEAPRSRR